MQLGGGFSGMLKDGYKSMSGLDMAILKNIEACKELGKKTTSSMGPNGMNKMVINHLEKLFVTSKVGTITEQLEVVHPAAKMLVMAAKMQEQESGDFTNYTIAVATELLRLAESLLRMGVHASDIVIGYKRASEHALKTLPDLVCHTIQDVRNKEQLIDVIKSVVATKQYGYEDLLSDKIADACIIAIPNAPRPLSLNNDNVRAVKMLGGSIHQSMALKGMCLNRGPLGSVREVKNAKIAVFGTSMEAAQTETKSTVLISNAEELLNYNKSEEKLLEEQIRGIAESGVTVCVSGGAISEMAMHFIEKYEMLIVKITSKWMLRRLCRATGATAVLRLGPVTPEEMGHCAVVKAYEVGDRTCCLFQQDDESSKIGTVVLRSSTINFLDDLERCVGDGVNCAKTLCSDQRCLAGAGACEIELASRISALGDETPGLEQYAIKKFAEALEVVPRTLAENAGMDSTEVISSLYAAHKKGHAFAGVNIEGGSSAEGVGLDMKAEKIFDTFKAKESALRLACDVAITILRVDQIIMSKQAGGPKK